MQETFCALCDKALDEQEQFYYGAFPVCDGCAGGIANQFARWHSGQPLFGSQPQIAGYRKKKIPASIRTQVFERDRYRCRYCGTHIDLTLDHIVPEIDGGESTPANLVTCCKSCNSRKGTKAWPLLGAA